MKYVHNVPILLVPYGVYHWVMLWSGLRLDQSVFTFAVASGAQLDLKVGTLIMLSASWLLLFDMLRGIRAGNVVVHQHNPTLHILFLGVALFEFYAVPIAGTRTFFQLMMLILVELLGSLGAAYYSRK